MAKLVQTNRHPEQVSIAERTLFLNCFRLGFILQGLARTQIPTNTNYAVEFPTFGEIAGVNPTVVQWKGLALGEPPSWSRLTPQPGKYELEEFAALEIENRDYFHVLTV